MPDDTVFNKDDQRLWFLASNYNASNAETKIRTTTSSIGLSTLIVFIAMYLGMVFLIVSCAILSLKQLTESSDNRQENIEF